MKKYFRHGNNVCTVTEELAADKKHLRDYCNSEKIRKKLENIMVNNITLYIPQQIYVYNYIKDEVLI